MDGDPAPDTLVQGIPGMSYISDFLNTGEEAGLIGKIDAQPWLTDLRRRVQHYGYKYDYKARRLDATMRIGPLPVFAGFVVERLAERGILCKPDQLIVNEYQPGQGIAAHVDCVPCFKEDICSISLGSACVMEFSSGTHKQSLLLEPRSILVLRGPARHEWKHGIPARKSDLVADKRMERGRRISLTFRQVILAHE